MQVSYRLDAERAKKLEQLFAYYGFTGNDSEKHKAMLDMLFDVMLNRNNSQSVNDQLAKHPEGNISIECPLRVKVPQIVKVLKGEKVVYQNQDFFYCVQWEKGKVRRQLKLISPLVCQICTLLKEQMVNEPQVIAEPVEIEESIASPAITFSVPAANSLKRAPRPELPMATWECEKKRCKVYYTVCFKCRKDSYLTYMGCIKANPQIALALAYWQKTSFRNLLNERNKF